MDLLSRSIESKQKVQLISGDDDLSLISLFCIWDPFFLALSIDIQHRDDN